MSLFTLTESPIQLDLPFGASSPILDFPYLFLANHHQPKVSALYGSRPQGLGLFQLEKLSVASEMKIRSQTLQSHMGLG